MTVPATDSKTIYLRLLRRVVPYRGKFALGVAAMFVLGLTEPALPAILERIVSSFEKHALDGVPLYAAVFLGIFLIRGLSSFLSVFALELVAARLVMDLRQDTFARLLHLPAPAYDSATSGSLISKVTFDAQQVTGAATRAVTILVRDSVAGDRPARMDAVDRLEAHLHRSCRHPRRPRRRRLLRPAVAANGAWRATHDGRHHSRSAGEHRRPSGGQGLLRPSV